MAVFIDGARAEKSLFRHGTPPEIQIAFYAPCFFPLLGVDCIRLQVFAVALVIVAIGSHQGVSSSNEISNRGLIRAISRRESTARASAGFFCNDASVLSCRAEKGKKRPVCIPGYCVGKAGFPHARSPPPVFAPSSYFSRRIFAGRQLARDRLSVVGPAQTASDRFQFAGRIISCLPNARRPPRAACSRRQFAISCQFCYLVLRMPTVQPGAARRGVAARPYFARPSFRSIARRAPVLRGIHSRLYPVQPNRTNEFDECGDIF